MRKQKGLIQGLAVATAFAASSVFAGTATNTMTNIATVAASCDVVAIGVDFGLTTFPLPTGGVTSVNANTTAGNLITQNTTHPNKEADGGSGNDDELALTTSVSTVNGLLQTALSAVTTAAPGVYVACTSNPLSISVTSGASGSSAAALPTNLAASAVVMAGKMTNTATSANQLDYTVSFLPAAVSTQAVNDVIAALPTFFLGTYVGTGTIPGTQTGTVVPGYYTDVATVVVNF